MDPDSRCGSDTAKAINEVLLTDDHSEHYSRRAVKEMMGAREEFAFLSKDATTALTSQSEGRTYWWTFAGLRANAALADAMQRQFNVGAAADNLAIKIEGLNKAGEMESIGSALKENPPRYGSCAEVTKAVDDLKFGNCLPIDLAGSMLSIRLSDAEAVTHTVNDLLRLITVP